MDPDMNIHSIEITDNLVPDIAMQEALIPSDLAIDKIIADGGYYSIAGVERFYLNPSWYETKLKDRQHKGYKGFKVLHRALQI